MSWIENLCLGRLKMTNLPYDWTRLKHLGFSEDSLNALNRMTVGNSFEKEPGETPKETKMSEVMMPRDNVLKRENSKNKTLPMKAAANEEGYAERVKSQKDCAPGERVVFGRCAKGDNMGDRDIDATQKKARAPGAPKVSNAKGPVMIKGRKMGWAIRDGKPVLVDWGSNAGVGVPKRPKTPVRKRSTRGLQDALSKQTTDSGRAAVQKQIDGAR